MESKGEVRVAGGKQPLSWRLAPYGLMSSGLLLALGVLVWPEHIRSFAPAGLVLLIVAARLESRRIRAERRLLLQSEERYRRLYEEAAREVTARRYAEEHLEHALRELENTMEAIPDILYQIDTQNRLVFWNRNLERVTGWSARELVGRPVQEFFAHEERSAVIETIERALEEGSAEVEARLLRKEGEPIPYHLAGSPLRDGDGNLIGLTGIGRDMSERRAAQDKLAKQAADLARSNAELESFAYIASHDLKEPLRGLHNYASFLREDYQGVLDEEGQRKLEALARLTQRMDALIEGLLQYSRIGRTEGAIGAVDLNRVAQESLETLAPRLEECRASVRIPRPLPRIICDRSRVRDVYLNLISNSMKYNDKDERWIELGWRDGEDPNWPVLFVRDNGIGIHQRHHERIFEIFRRLHGRDRYGGGTGAGLSIVKKIIDTAGGSIHVESTPGQGTTMCFELGPFAPAQADDELQRLPPLEHYPPQRSANRGSS